ncbi:hypothetical protein BSM4216_2271 [Bacillus smithii]|nr:hypothetical protein BSM4216_2271 [Bacillus smithii]
MFQGTFRFNDDCTFQSDFPFVLFYVRFDFLAFFLAAEIKKCHRF